MKLSPRQALALLCVPLLAGADARAEAGSKEYLVKAAYLYNFIKFVEWPGEMAVSKQKNIDVCVLGANPFDAQASTVLAAASTPALKIALVEERDVRAAAGHCHIVYISRAEEGRVRDILDALKGSHALTVSDIEGFAEKQGMVGFGLAEGKVKLNVNTAALSQAGLRMDAQLLEVAGKVIR